MTTGTSPQVPSGTDGPGSGEAQTRRDRAAARGGGRSHVRLPGRSSSSKVQDALPEKKSKANVARGSILMASGSLVSRGLGLVRTSLIVTLFGAQSSAGDAWQIANTLPTTVYMLLAAGVVNAVFVPQLTKAAERPDGGREYVDSLVTFSLLSLLVTTVVAVPMAPFLVRLFASDSWSHATFDLATKFAYIVLPAIFFYGLYAVLGQILNAQGQFGAYGWAPALCNVVWIAGLGIFLAEYPGKGKAVSEWTGPMMWMVGGSLTVGVAVQALILLLPLWRSGWRYRPRFEFRGMGLGSAGRVASWTFAGIGVSQASLIVASRVLTAEEGQGVGRLGYDTAFFLFMTPHGLITVSLATALFTAMSTDAARRNLFAVRGHLRKGLRLIGVTTIPTTVAGLCLAVAGMAMVFPTRPLEETRAMSDIFLVLILALLPYGVLFLVQRAFYAFEDARTPFYLSTVAAVLFSGGAALAWVVLPGEFRAVGVALSATVSDIVAAAVGLRWVSSRLGGMRFVDVWETWTRSCFASLVAGLWTLLVVGIFQTVLPNRAGSLLILIFGGTLYVATYLGAGRWLRIQELDDLLSPLLRRLPRFRKDAAHRA